jgi:hypothetical protein
MRLSAQAGQSSQVDPKTFSSSQSYKKRQMLIYQEEESKTDGLPKKSDGLML